MCSLSSRYTAVEYARQLRAFLDEYDQVAVVGKLCALQDCAFAVRQGSPLRQQINCAIVRLSDSGEAKGIRAKWFGN
jgi:ABC-type amino acid transport substrate-binding protein